MKKIISLAFFLFVNVVFSQNSSSLKDESPLFQNCKTTSESEKKTCFTNTIQQHVFTTFQLNEKFKTPDFKSEVITVFSVDENGKFSIAYIDASEPELKEEMIRVFETLPVITPAMRNGKAVNSKHTLTFQIPLKKQDLVNSTINEFENMEYQTFDNPKFESGLNIPFSHSYYAQFDDELNQVGNNNHTASKPFLYKEVAQYYDFKKQNDALKIEKKSWFGRKLWNEEMVSFKGKEYWFTLNPIVDLRLGKDQQSEISYTYQNTRGIQAQGAIGKNLFFTTTIFESQGRFADYYNQYAESIKPSGGNPAIIPGIGIAKNFKTNAYDFPSADANITYSASKMLNVQMGYGRNFIGDGYRSLLTSDITSPYPYLKINTNFWKIKYTNTYASLKDVRPEVTADNSYATKYMVNHYLSWNVTKRWNMGFFESVIWTNSNGRGFDLNFVNPVIFYRSVEFASSSKSGNALLGLTSKYKISNSINIYGQFLLDEFSLGDIKAQEGSWKNKYATQLGVKYFNAFGVDKLLLQAEYNMARPYVYSHSEAITNYAHNNQSIGHLWGSNFKEFIAIARYFKGRWFAEGKLISGIKGLDFDTSTDSKNYGSNIYKDYDENRSADKGVVVGQGNKTMVLIGDLQLGYIVNPITNLKAFAGLTYRNFSPAVSTSTVFNQTTTWFSVGIRTDIYNLYTDF